jgi:hypothetical protein
MLQSAMPLSAMDPETMRAVYNNLAAVLKMPPAARGLDRFELGKGIALLRATPKPKPVIEAPVAVNERLLAVRPSIIRDAALTELSRVVAYQNTKTGKVEAAECHEEHNDDGDQWVTVGATYAEVAAKVRKQVPRSRISPNVLRRFVHHVKKVADMEERKQPVPPLLEAYRNVVLPERRPKPRTVGVPNGRPEDAPRPVKFGRPARTAKRRRLSKPSAKRSPSKRGRTNNVRNKRR